MVDNLRFTMENRSRIHAVESSFGPTGKSLVVPGRILVGEGRLLKLCRRSPQPKAFFLFNDILVYGSIVVPGRWNKKQKIIRLEEVCQEDLQDGVGMTNQWLLRTPRKSFQVAAASADEKRAWMEHIDECRTQQLQSLGLASQTAGTRDFAAIWVPDRASAICMRCSDRFHVAHRRHHCRRCGFVVCGNCSKSRAVLRHISAKPVRVCAVCNASMRKAQEELQKQVQQQERQKEQKRSSTEDTPEFESSSEEEEEEEEDPMPTQWFSGKNEIFATYCYLDLAHTKAPIPRKEKRGGPGSLLS